MKRVLAWVLATGGLLAALHFLPQGLIAALGSETPAAVVVSRSMWPFLNRGDVIFIRGTTREEVSAGTILVFKHRNGIAIHRVVRLEGETIVTKGDANPKEDDPITFDDVVGRLPTPWGHPAKIPWVGRIALWMGSQDSGPAQGGPQAGPPGLLRAFGNLIGNPFGLVLLVVFPAGLVLTLTLMEVVPRIGPGRKRRRWRQRRLERVGKRRRRFKLAYR